MRASGHHAFPAAIFSRVRRSVAGPSPAHLHGHGGPLVSQAPPSARLLAKLLAAATAGAAPAGPASKRQPIRMVLDPDERPVGKGALCGQSRGSTYKPPPASLPTTNPAASACADTSCAHASLLANDRLSILDDGNVRLEFKRPWSDGTSGSRRKVVSPRVCGYELVVEKGNPRECSPGVRGPVPPQGGVE
jgi:hypothetical protein